MPQMVTHDPYEVQVVKMTRAALKEVLLKVLAKHLEKPEKAFAELVDDIAIRLGFK